MEKDNLNKNISKKIEYFLRFLNHLFSQLLKKINKIEASSNLKKRIISSAILIIIALYAILSSGSLFLLLAILAAIIMTMEWVDLIKNADDQKKWRLIGLAYILLPIYSALQIKAISSQVLLWMFAIIWATDIAAFFGGKIFGGKKLAPHISPNKTWSGLGCGVVASMIIGLISSFMFTFGNVIFFIFISALLALIEQASDLIESKFKRIFAIKDSGSLIPGHGGVLDRLDGMILIAPIVLMILLNNPTKFIG
jgi:phosphatidate cytidylyltransferase